MTTITIVDAWMHYPQVGHTGPLRLSEPAGPSPTWTAWPPADCLAGLDALGLDQDALGLFLHANACRVFGLA